MIVSFDLDDTLFVDPLKIKTENPLGFPYKHIYKERLRLGTIALFQRIQNNGIKLWIYTTSYRSERYIRSFFKCYGIKIDGVVNGHRHEAEVQGKRKEAFPSKYPSRYKIALHIDDDPSVAQNGSIYGFKVYLLNNNDVDWHQKIWEEVEKLNRK